MGSLSLQYHQPCQYLQHRKSPWKSPCMLQRLQHATSISCYPFTQRLNFQHNSYTESSKLRSWKHTTEQEKIETSTRIRGDSEKGNKPFFWTGPKNKGNENGRKNWQKKKKKAFCMMRRRKMGKKERRLRRTGNARSVEKP